LNFRVRAWSLPSVSSTPIYISPASSPNYFYIYRESQIKYQVEIDQQTRKVIGFTAKKSYARFQKGGAFLTAHWGDHLTVAVQRTNHHLLLKNHLTRYEINHEDQTQTSYIRDAVYCDIALTKTIDSASKCIQAGLVTPLTLNIYNQIPKPDPHVIPILQGLVKEIMKENDQPGSSQSPKGKGGSTIQYIQFNGRRHRLYVGSKGGQYVLTNRRKVYIKQKGGNSPLYEEEGFSELFVRFIKETRIDPVIASSRIQTTKTMSLSSIEIIDEEESNHMMFLYHHDLADDIMSETKIFAIEKRLMFDAFEVYKIPVSERTPQQQVTYDAFTVLYEPLPVRMIEVVGGNSKD
jgi:hypothetical protein